MICHGVLDVGLAASVRCLQGAPVVVTELRGEPLVSPGQAELRVLPVAEVELLVWDILEALAELQVGARCEGIGGAALGEQAEGGLFV
jgi:hypothetical protein